MQNEDSQADHCLVSLVGDVTADEVRHDGVDESVLGEQTVE